MGWESVKVTADTNILVRASVLDDPQQARAATRVLRDAEIVAVTLPTLCEFAWVLSRGYKRSATEIAAAMRHLVGSASVATDRPAVDAGLAMLEAGGDFADGVIVFEGQRLGGEVFVSFDRRAVSLVRTGGGQTRLLSGTSRAH
jgi:predicted nucleic-acid-binding protein